MRLKYSAAVILTTLVSLSSAGQQPAAPADVDLGLEKDGLPREIDGFAGEVRGLWRDGRVFIAGQPDEAAFARFRELGVTVVVNLRTPTEMDNRTSVPFDEDVVVTGLGMEYVRIPVGGEDHPYSPDAVMRFAEVLEHHRGPVLLHCTVGWRASYLWSAYLIDYQGFSLAGAMARGEAMAISDLPIEGLLGRQIELEFAD